MATELQVIRASEFVRVGPDSQFNLEESRSVLRDIALICRRRGVDQVLLDLREIRPEPTPRFSPNDVAALVGIFAKAGLSPSQRLAVLYTEDPHQRARLLAFIASLRGWKVRAFENYEEAIGWLAGTRETETRPLLTPPDSMRSSNP